MKPIARKDDLVIQEVAGEILVYDLRTNKAICLNQTSALVWQNCDGNKNTFEIAEDMEKKLGNPVKEDLVWFAVKQLEKEKLLDNEVKIDNRFEGLSRREVVKKIGFSALIAVPVIASLTTPVSAGANTCTGMCGQTLACPTVTTCMCSNNSSTNNGTCGL